MKKTLDLSLVASKKTGKTVFALQNCQQSLFAEIVIPSY